MVVFQICDVHICPFAYLERVRKIGPLAASWECRFGLASDRHSLEQTTQEFHIFITLSTTNNLFSSSSFLGYPYRIQCGNMKIFLGYWDIDLLFILEIKDAKLINLQDNTFQERKQGNPFFCFNTLHTALPVAGSELCTIHTVNNRQSLFNTAIAKPSQTEFNRSVFYHLGTIYNVVYVLYVLQFRYCI